MPRKLRELENDLALAGFKKTRAKGSHRKWTHPSGYVVVISGQGGSDARRYQEEDVEEALAAISRQAR